MSRRCDVDGRATWPCPVNGLFNLRIVLPGKNIGSSVTVTTSKAAPFTLCFKQVKIGSTPLLWRRLAWYSCFVVLVRLTCGHAWRRFGKVWVYGEWRVCVWVLVCRSPRTYLVTFSRYACLHVGVGMGKVNFCRPRVLCCCRRDAGARLVRGVKPLLRSFC